MKRKYVHIKQHDITDCGCACIAMIAETYGLKLPVAAIREASGTDRHGTSAYGVIKAAEQFGFAGEGLEGSPEEFMQADFQLPCIAHVITKEGMEHYIVVYEIHKDKLIIADPAKDGIKEEKPEKFFEIWSGVVLELKKTEKFRKGNRKKGTLTGFLKLLFPQKKLFFLIIFCSFLLTAIGIITSFYFQIIMDIVVPENSYRLLTGVSLAAIALYVGESIFSAVRTHMMIKVGQNIDYSLYLGYFEHVLHLPMGFFTSRKNGEIFSRFADAGKIRDAIANTALSAVLDTSMAVIGGVVLFKANYILFLIALCMMILYGIFVFSFNKPIKNADKQAMEDYSQMRSYFLESLNGIETVKSYHAENKVEKKSTSLFQTAQKSDFKANKIMNLQSFLTNLVHGIGGTAILWIGTISVLNGEMTFGELMTFNSLLGYFLSPVQNILNLQTSMQSAIASAERLKDIMDLKQESESDDNRTENPESLFASVSISNLAFRYGTRELTLHDINMTIQAGEKIALVGESGSGKTTLAKLLLNFYQPEKGTIRIGEIPLEKINLAVLRNKVVYISQNNFLFSGTVMENLKLGSKDADEEEIKEICRQVKADDFIMEMPLGYQTVLDENGNNLSGGQKQRLSIARALIQKPDILIMDEATSNLDNITEQAVQDTINHLSEKMTVIIIAHRLSTIRSCDRIFVMQKGSIIEEGTHEELIAGQGCYYQMQKAM